ncbi:hypothetical protein [Streptomyces sp. NPDC055189]
MQLLPGRDAWYVTGLNPAHADGGLLRHWAATGRPAILYHHRDPRDRALAVIEHLTCEDGDVGTMPGHLVYRDILTVLRGTDAGLALALATRTSPATKRHGTPGGSPAIPPSTPSHEELAGPHHGGTTNARTRALQCLAAWLPGSMFHRPPPPGCRILPRGFGVTVSARHERACHDSAAVGDLPSGVDVSCA